MRYDFGTNFGAIVFYVMPSFDLIVFDVTPFDVIVFDLIIFDVLSSQKSEHATWSKLLGYTTRP